LYGNTEKAVIITEKTGIAKSKNYYKTQYIVYENFAWRRGLVVVLFLPQKKNTKNFVLKTKICLL